MISKAVDDPRTAAKSVDICGRFCYAELGIKSSELLNKIKEMYSPFDTLTLYSTR